MQSNKKPVTVNLVQGLYFLIEILIQVQNDKTISHCERKRGNPAFVYFLISWILSGKSPQNDDMVNLCHPEFISGSLFFIWDSETSSERHYNFYLYINNIFIR